MLNKLASVNVLASMSKRWPVMSMSCSQWRLRSASLFKFSMSGSESWNALIFSSTRSYVGRCFRSLRSRSFLLNCSVEVASFAMSRSAHSMELKLAFISWWRLYTSYTRARFFSWCSTSMSSGYDVSGRSKSFSASTSSSRVFMRSSSSSWNSASLARPSSRSMPGRPGPVASRSVLSWRASSTKSSTCALVISVNFSLVSSRLSSTSSASLSRSAKRVRTLRASASSASSCSRSYRMRVR
mmetsp:Transcript_2857/g.10067  ORF Transcript_2857/g.10067 Transcript_2857/m.10067 type:complete len:241 (-) Transcript_2857:3332-4054(-)